MSNLIATDVQKQEVDSGVIELFILDLPDHLAESDNSRLYFHAGTDENLSNITFRDNYSSTISGSTQFHSRTYVALPASLEGISIDSEGATARPTITIANAETLFRNSIETNGGFTNKDLIGCRVTKRTTLKKHLATGSASTAPVEFPVSIYIIDRISSEDSIFIQFELTTPYDLETITLPRRVIIGKYCSWEYQGFQVDGSKKRGACSWKRNSSLGTGLTAYFDEQDRPLVPATMFSTGSASSTNYSIYNSSTTYTVNDYVYIVSGPTYWLSLINDNVGNNPPDSIGIWQEVKVWTDWVANASYVVGALVKYAPSGTSIDQTIWKCVLAHTSTANNKPVNKSAFWIRGDVCGKELGSCAIRYGAQRAKESTLPFAPSGQEDTSVNLPFGAFPGTDRFK